MHYGAQSKHTEPTMNAHRLIDALVRQTMVLIAQVATSGGARAPLAHVADQVFLDLVAELDRQGISRKVGADMFGLALRSYQRKISRLGESRTDRGRSLWEAVLGYVKERPLVSRAEVLRRFHYDEAALVRGVLQDLSDSGLLFTTGRGPSASYRAASEEELARAQGGSGLDSEGLDALLWVLVYREGPLEAGELARRASMQEAVVDAALGRLVAAGRAERVESAGAVRYRSAELVVPLGADVGWEAAVLDHFQAMVQTICQRLRGDAPSEHSSEIGGSTYTFVVWPGHPAEQRVRGWLAERRAEASALRASVDEHNAAHGIPSEHTKVMAYVGQSVIREGAADSDESEDDDAAR